MMLRMEIVLRFQSCLLVRLGNATFTENHQHMVPFEIVLIWNNKIQLHAAEE